MIVGLLAAAAVMMPVAADADTIRFARARHNAAIAARDLPATLALAAPDYVLTAGSGAHLRRPAEVKEAWRKSFADPDFIRYVRTPTAVTVSDDGERAAEEGDWRGEFRDSRPHGRYFAHWRRVADGWKTVAETFVTLGCEGPGC